MRPLWLYVPCPNQTVAETLAKIALEARLAGCANIIPGVVSMYWWEGQLVNDQETILLLKTEQQSETKLRTLLETNHPYTIPCVASISIPQLNPAYSDWLLKQLDLSDTQTN